MPKRHTWHTQVSGGGQGVGVQIDCAGGLVPGDVILADVPGGVPEPADHDLQPKLAAAQPRVA
jgi:hypothetical protein